MVDVAPAAGVADTEVEAVAVAAGVVVVEAEAAAAVVVVDATFRLLIDPATVTLQQRRRLISKVPVQENINRGQDYFGLLLVGGPLVGSTCRFVDFDLGPV